MLNVLSLFCNQLNIGKKKKKDLKVIAFSFNLHFTQPSY